MPSLYALRAQRAGPPGWGRRRLALITGCVVLSLAGYLLASDLTPPVPDLGHGRLTATPGSISPGGRWDHDWRSCSRAQITSDSDGAFFWHPRCIDLDEDDVEL